MYGFNWQATKLPFSQNLKTMQHMPLWKENEISFVNPMQCHTTDDTTLEMQ